MTTTSYPPLDASSPSSSPKPFLTIKARRGWVAINLRELWRFRDLLRSFTVRDVKLRYKQTALGVSWVVLQPLIAAAIFSYVFNGLAKLDRDSTIAGQLIPSFPYVFNGMVLWNLFAGIVSKASGSLVSNSSMVSKVYFPRLLMPFSGATAGLVDLAIAVTLMLGIQIGYGVPIGWHIIAAPVVVLLVMAAALGIGTWAGATAVKYRDVGYIVPVMVQFLLFASPIAYSISEFKGRSGALFKFNPLAGLIGLWRWAVMDVAFPPMWMAVYSACVAIVLFFAGVMVFRRLERNFADVI